jgi:WD40 repeat protein
MVVTFYSFKGGVGRSMALANIAEILASFGYHVIACDWDLEAPGLERLFSETLAQSDDLAARPGLMDLLRTYKETLAGALTAPPDRRTHLQVGDVWLMRPSHYAMEVSTAQRGGSVRLLSAGARPAQNYGRYADEVRGFDWKDFYEEWAGGAYVDFFRDELSAGPVTPSGERLQPSADIVLVDSRTGVTEHGGVCTHHLADLVVLMSAANDSNFYGSLRIAKSLAAPELQASRSGRAVRVLPVRTRIDIASQVAEVNDFRRRFNDTFSQFVPVGLHTRGTFFEDTEIPYIGLYSFGEANLSRGATQREPNLFKAYHKLAEAIVECGVDAGLLRDNNAAATARSDVRLASERTQPVTGAFDAIATPASKEVASALASDLLKLGANIRVRTGGRGRKAEEGEARGTVGAILIVTRDAPPEWVRAQFDELLRRRALAPSFRVTPVVMPDVDVSAYPFLHRARVVHLDAESGPARVGRLVRELAGPPPAIAFEPATVCPYPGPKPFEEADARLFFGRDDEIFQLTGRVDPRQPLVIAGPKGVGKRSLVNAGLLPALHRGELVDGFVMGPLVQCHFGANPFAELAAALAAVDRDRDAATIRRTLEQRPEALAEIVAAKTAPDQTFVLCVYSLENLFVPGADAAASARLVQAVRTALAGPSRLFVIATLSTDVLEGQVPAFLSSVPHISVTISRLTRVQLVTAIAAPARLAGLAVDAAVIERIAGEAEENAAPTALVQRLLRSLWHRRSGQALTDVSLQAIGSLPGAAIEAANERMAAMTPAQQEAAKRLLASLALAESRGSKSMTRADAIKRCGDEAPAVLARLSDSPPILDVRAHTVGFAGSTLRRHWIPLRTWSDHERERLHVRRWRYAYAAAAAVVLLFISFAVLVNRSNTIRESERIAIDSQQRLQDDPLEALGLAIAAATTAETDGAKRALVEALAARYPSAVLRHDAPVGTAAFSPDGKLVATGDDAGNVQVWEVETATVRQRLKHGARVTAVRFSPDGSRIATASYDGSVAAWSLEGQQWRTTTDPLERVVTLEYNPDGRQLVAGGLDGRMWIIDASSGTVVSRQEHRASITSGMFSDDGRRILTTSFDGRVAIWNAASYAEPTTETPFPAPEGIPFPVVSGAFVDGGAIVVAGAPGAAVVERGTLRRLLSVSDVWDVPALSGAQEPALAVSDDGSMVAFGGPGGAQLVALDGRVISVIYPTLPSGRPVGNIVDVEFHPSDPQILLADEAGHAILSDARTATQVGVFDGHRGRLRFAKFSPDGRTIVTGSDDSTAALWKIAHEIVPRESPFGFLLERATAAVPKNVRLADIVPDRGQQEE